MTPTQPHRTPDPAGTPGHEQHWLPALGICPLVGAVTSLLSGLGVALATLLMLCATAAVIAMARPRLRPEVRLPATLVLMAALAAAIGSVLQIYLFEAWLLLGATVPVLVANAAVLAQAEATSGAPPAAALGAAARSAGRIVTLLLAVGAMREIIGHGTLLADAAGLAQAPGALSVRLLPADVGLVAAVTPAAGLLVLGLLVGLGNALAIRRAPWR